MPTIDIKGSGNVEYRAIQFSGDATVMHFRIRQRDIYLIGVNGTPVNTIQSVNELLKTTPRRNIQRIRPDEKGSVSKDGQIGTVNFSFSGEKKLVTLNWLLDLKPF